MIQKTKIEWCDYTANPIRYRRDDDPTGQRGPVWACVKASEGCQHCYAETLAKRFQGREFTASAMRGVVPYVDEGELRVAWLRHAGWNAVWWDAEAGGIPPGFAIASGPGPRGVRHSVVSLDGELAHDPHPSNASLESVDMWTLVWRREDGDA